MKTELISQYKASLNMLTDVIKKCPDALWEDAGYKSTYCRMVYHTLYYTALYLSESPEKFIPWPKHINGYNNLGKVNKTDERVGGNNYSRDDLLSYAGMIARLLDDSIVETELFKKSEFFWLGMNKFELHLYNTRHIQHHTGQLIERLHQNGIKGIKWEGKG